MEEQHRVFYSENLEMDTSILPLARKKDFFYLLVVKPISYNLGDKIKVLDAYNYAIVKTALDLIEDSCSIVMSSLFNDEAYDVRFIEAISDANFNKISILPKGANSLDIAKDIEKMEPLNMFFYLRIRAVYTGCYFENIKEIDKSTRFNASLLYFSKFDDPKLKLAADMIISSPNNLIETLEKYTKTLFYSQNYEEKELSCRQNNALGYLIDSFMLNFKYFYEHIYL